MSPEVQRHGEPRPETKPPSVGGATRCTTQKRGALGGLQPDGSERRVSFATTSPHCGAMVCRGVATTSPFGWWLVVAPIHADVAQTGRALERIDPSSWREDSDTRGVVGSRPTVCAETVPSLPPSGRAQHREPDSSTARSGGGAFGGGSCPS